MGISAVAAPVRDSFGTAVAAVSIPYLTALRNEAELIEPLLECTEGISRRLGFDAKSPVSSP